MTDIEIARSVKLKSIKKIASKLGINEEYLEYYGNVKAKLSHELFDNIKENIRGNLILVSAMNPTPLGEGKTTISIAIADALTKLKKKTCLALREPSLGPVFGIKGGATGGGQVQIAPMEDINLHFTGDLHAITTANNLLAAMIDNHIYFGNELGFDKVVFKRCMDMNDRTLRKIEVGLSDLKQQKREDVFDITAASEIMAILCLSKDIKDLKKRLGDIIVGFTKSGDIIYARDLKAEGAMTVVLKDAIKPNLVQTLYGTPAIVHGGPFANIAHGCNSVIATTYALHLADYVVTEAGFGADLGAEKYLDIKARNKELIPNVVVLVATIKALKYHGGVAIDDIKKENNDAIKIGLNNLYKHASNIKNNFKLNVIIALNRYNTDTDREIEYTLNEIKTNGYEVSVVEGYTKGASGAIDIARKIDNLLQEPKNFTYAYDLNMSIKEKIENVALNIYGASKVVYEEEALKNIKILEKSGFSNYPICIAKTQYSLSDDPKLLDTSGGFTITVRDVNIKNGAKFIVVLAGNIMTMPGLPRIPAAENIDIDESNNIVGIF